MRRPETVWPTIYEVICPEPGIPADSRHLRPRRHATMLGMSPRLRLLLTISVTAALASCADHGDPDLNAHVVSADHDQLCVSVVDNGFDDLNGCYPIDPAAPAVQAGDCIAARFPSAGSGRRPDTPLSRLKIVSGGCGD